MKKYTPDLIFFLLCSGNLAFAQVTLSSSKLPIVIITTENATSIPNEPKVNADLEIIYNGEGKMNSVTDVSRNYKGKIGIELRLSLIHILVLVAICFFSSHLL